VFSNFDKVSIFGLPDFESVLYKYLCFVRSGEEVIIMDRDQPVAKLVGVHAASTVVIKEASADLRSILLASDKRAFTETSDILDVLTQDREERF
jgi:antitoxin (DNA-binding transcriptional repressor) of toxin-antitoxin stability system